jgi:hypothetical protein
VRRHDWSAFNSAPTPHNSRKLQISFSKLEEVDADESRWAQESLGSEPQSLNAADARSTIIVTDTDKQRRNKEQEMQTGNDKATEGARIRDRLDGWAKAVRAKSGESRPNNALQPPPRAHGAAVAALAAGERGRYPTEGSINDQHNN